MNYEMTLFFRQFWTDPRLAWGEHSNGTFYERQGSPNSERCCEHCSGISDKRKDNTYNVAADMLDLIWVPDSFFIDEIDSSRHDIMTRNVFLEIHKNGYILYSD